MTGVQTCALPISSGKSRFAHCQPQRIGQVGCQEVQLDCHLRSSAPRPTDQALRGPQRRPPRDPLPKKSSGSVAPIEDRTTEAVSGSTCPGDRVARTKQSKEHANRSVKHRPGERARSPRSTRSVKHEHRGALKHQQSRCTLPIGRGMTKCADASHRATRLRFVMPTPNRPGGKRPRAGALTN